MAVDVTVLLVTYNHEDYVERAIASIESQVTARSLEVIVADDSSTDATLTVLSEWAARSSIDVRILEPQERLGITRNYARGFAAARGTYVAVLEGDDEWIAVDKIERQAAALDANPQLTMSATRVLLYDEDRAASQVIPMIGNDRFLTEITDRQLADTNWFATFSCCMYRRSVLSLLDPEVFEITSYDWMVNMAVLAHGNAAFLPEVMSLYRQHSAGEWSQKNLLDRDSQLQELIPQYARILGSRVSRELSRASANVEERLRHAVAHPHQTPAHPAENRLSLPIPRVTAAQPPRVSVVMAVYNHAPYVLEAVNSVLDQTVDDLELIVVDDGSRDDSLQMLSTVVDPRLRVYPLETNQGAAAALNIAIQQSRAPFVAVINSDDAWEPTKLARQLEEFGAHPEAGAVFTGVRLVGPDSKPLPAASLPDWNGIFRQANRSQAAWLRRFFEQGNCLCHPSVLIRREYYERHGLMDNRLRQIPDLKQWVTLLKNYPIRVLGDEELVRFRLLPKDANASSTSESNVVRGVREHLDVNEHFFDGMSDELVREAFGDVLRDPLFHTAAERACAIAFLWLDVESPTRGVNRVQGLRELRAALGSTETSLILLARYGVTDLNLHELTRVPDDLPAVEHAQWLAAGGVRKAPEPLAMTPSGTLLRVLAGRMRRSNPLNWPRRALVAWRIARGRGGE